MLRRSVHVFLVVNESTLSPDMVCQRVLRLKVRGDSEGCGGCGGSMGPSQSVGSVSMWSWVLFTPLQLLNYVYYDISTSPHSCACLSTNLRGPTIFQHDNASVQEVRSMSTWFANDQPPLATSFKTLFRLPDSNWIPKDVSESGCSSCSNPALYAMYNLMRKFQSTQSCGKGHLAVVEK